MNAYPFVSNDTALEAVLKSFANSLTVALIATWELEICAPEENPLDIFQRQGLQTISQVPVRSEGKIIGVLEKGKASGKTAGESMIPLNDKMLISQVCKFPGPGFESLSLERQYIPCLIEVLANLGISVNVNYICIER